MANACGPVVTAEQMAAVDRAMTGELALDLRQIMETAGQAVARVARARFLGGDPRGTSVVVLCGSGGNGGDGYVAARVLQGWGASVAIFSARTPAELSGVAAQQCEIVRRCGIDVSDELPEQNLAADLIVDGLLGFSLRGAPTGAYALLVDWANAHTAPVLAIDLPSGLDGTTGMPLDPCINADATVTLGLIKRGLLAESARMHVGSLVLADVGIPLAAYRAAGIEAPPIFAQREWIEITA